MSPARPHRQGNLGSPTLQGHLKESHFTHSSETVTPHSSSQDIPERSQPAASRQIIKPCEASFKSRIRSVSLGKSSCAELTQKRPSKAILKSHSPKHSSKYSLESQYVISTQTAIFCRLIPEMSTLARQRLKEATRGGHKGHDCRKHYLVEAL